MLQLETKAMNWFPRPARPFFTHVASQLSSQLVAALEAHGTDVEHAAVTEEAALVASLEAAYSSAASKVAASGGGPASSSASSPSSSSSSPSAAFPARAPSLTHSASSSSGCTHPLLQLELGACFPPPTVASAAAFLQYVRAEVERIELGLHSHSGGSTNVPRTYLCTARRLLRPAFVLMRV
ncbi:MAG: hypothetical protein EOO65_01950 [Methanosarcinales archaeon]|nr:MAG: hypothetical protein EOO65_01950 [Methanosarcinales archaeon]